MMAVQSLQLNPELQASSTCYSKQLLEPAWAPDALLLLLRRWYICDTHFPINCSEQLIPEKDLLEESTPGFLNSAPLPSAQLPSEILFSMFHFHGTISRFTFSSMTAVCHVLTSWKHWDYFSLRFPWFLSPNTHKHSLNCIIHSKTCILIDLQHYALYCRIIFWSRDSLWKEKVILQLLFTSFYFLKHFIKVTVDIKKLLGKQMGSHLHGSSYHLH